ncbi:hypothetical protein [Cellulomonas soli]
MIGTSSATSPSVRSVSCCAWLSETPTAGRPSPVHVMRTGSATSNSTEWSGSAIVTCSVLPAAERADQASAADTLVRAIVTSPGNGSFDSWVRVAVS